MAYCYERLKADLHTFWTANFKCGIGTDGGGSQWTSELNRVLDGKILWVNGLRYFLYLDQLQWARWQQWEQPCKGRIPVEHK